MHTKHGSHHVALRAPEAGKSRQATVPIFERFVPKWMPMTVAMPEASGLWYAQKATKRRPYKSEVPARLSRFDARMDGSRSASDT
jgi:hypothetical protein